MSKWHYRIMQSDDGTWGVHEVFHDDDDDWLQPDSWTADAVFAAGSDSVEEVQSAIRMMAGDAYRPPLSKIWQDDYLDRQADHVELMSEDARMELGAILEAGHPNSPCPDCVPYWPDA